MKREALTKAVQKKFPFIVGFGFKEQWDMDKQPYLCIFLRGKNRTDRIFTL